MINDIKNKLLQHFNPDYLEVIDVSIKHKGHLGYIEGSISHIDIIISSKKFKNLSRIEIHRKINHVLEKEWKKGIHAVSIKIRKS